MAAWLASANKSPEQPIAMATAEALLAGAHGQPGSPVRSPRKRRYPVAKVKGGWTQEEDDALRRWGTARFPQCRFVAFLVHSAQLLAS